MIPILKRKQKEIPVYEAFDMGFQEEYNEKEQDMAEDKQE